MNPNTAEPVAPPAAPGLWYYVRMILKPIASLQLTVVLFALATALVFFGTVAMMTKGLWTVVDEYFRSGLVWIPFDLLRRFGTVFFDLPKDAEPWRGSFPFPGGWLIGGVMLVNLLAAHLIRFKLSWRRSGIIILHAGMVLLMVGELITGLFAVESTMTIRTGETADFIDITREMEIAVLDRSDPKEDHYVLVPERMFSRPGVVRDEQLPFDLEVVEYWKNTAMKISETRPEGQHVFPTAIGYWVQLDRQDESAGVDTEAHGDAPSVAVRVLDKQSGQVLAEHFLSVIFYPNHERNRRLFRFDPRTVTVGGKEYVLELRHKRVYKPYSVELLKFEHGKYPGTDIPKDFASTVKVTDTATGDAREVRIWMNNPLRYQGDSLFQSAVLQRDSGTVLLVVRNPGRLLPYIACTLVALGMIIHFGIRLSRFQQKGATA
jgi:hypothetical protein